MEFGQNGEYRAVFVYQMDAYRYWESQLGRNDFVFGQFGENFTVDGLPDEEVCVGDQYRIGSALFEITQPRVTCYRVGIRMNEPQMAALLVSHRKPGFYFRVLQEWESRSVLSLVLVPADKQPLVAALPGQFVVLRLKPKPDAPPLLRNYSLSDTPAADHYRVSVRQEVNGAASTYVHNQVHVGNVLDVSAPRGTFTFRTGNNPVVLLSAGVGATPVLAMLHALAAEASKREVCWLFGARNRDEHPFAQESRRCLQSLLNSRSYILYSRPGPQDRQGQDFDAPGHLNTTVLEEIGVPRDADFYLCGPAPFLQDLTTGLAAWGVSTDHVHTEIFGPGASCTPGVVDAPRQPPHLPARSAGTGPLVSFSRSGLVVHWAPAFQSLLELAEACDVPVRWSCRTGVCHTCESGLIEGLVSYQPEPLEPPADGTLLICCSQPRDEVMLDL